MQMFWCVCQSTTQFVLVQHSRHHLVLLLNPLDHYPRTIIYRRNTHQKFSRVLNFAYICITFTLPCTCMFHAIWEFAQSENPQIGSQSADCYAICRLRGESCNLWIPYAHYIESCTCACANNNRCQEGITLQTHRCPTR